MLNLIYEDDGRMIINGFKYLVQSDLIEVAEYGGMIRVCESDDMKHPDYCYYFRGLRDPLFKSHMLKYFKRRNVKGLVFTEIEEDYYELITKHAPPIEQAIKECSQHIKEDPTNFYIFIL